MISIVCPIYNKEKYLEETIKSVLNQTSSLWELLLVDDGSSDRSLEIARRYATEVDAISFYERKTIRPDLKGANACRNIGAQCAKGRWLMFLDADDLLLPHCIMQRLQEAESDAGHFNMMIFRVAYAKGTPPEIYDKKHPAPEIFKSLSEDKANLKEVCLSKFLKFDLPWHTTGVLWEKAFFTKLNGFNENYQRLQDPEIHTRALLEQDVSLSYKAHLLPEDTLHRMDEDRLVWNAQTFFNKQLMSIVQFANDMVVLMKKRKYSSKIYLLQGYLLFGEMLVYNFRRTGEINAKQGEEILNQFYSKVPTELLNWKYRLIRNQLRVISRNAFFVKKRFPGLFVFIYKKLLR